MENGIQKEKEKSQKSKKKLSSLLLMLLLTGVMLTVATYAWFTSNKTVTISTLDVNVETQGGLQISADGSTWKTVLQNGDIRTGYTGAVNQIPTVLEPVSTGKTLTNGKLDMYYGVVGTNTDGEFILTTTKATEANGTSGKFIVFDTFLRSEAATDLYMTTSSSVVATDPANDTGLKNSARVAFVVEGNTPISSSLDTIRGLNSGQASTTYIWEPNYDVHTGAGVSAARDIYGITTSETGGSLLPYDGVIGEMSSTDEILLTETDSTHYSSLFSPVTVNYSTITGFSSYQQVFSLSAGITKVRIYMWVEGQDVDCENNASGSGISFNIQLSTNSSAA